VDSFESNRALPRESSAIETEPRRTERARMDELRERRVAGVGLVSHEFEGEVSDQDAFPCCYKSEHSTHSRRLPCLLLSDHFTLAREQSNLFGVMQPMLKMGSC
jgi:hypothetical protein